jgi:hypothetical protein
VKRAKAAWPLRCFALQQAAKYWAQHQIEPIGKARLFFAKERLSLSAFSMPMPAGRFISLAAFPAPAEWLPKAPSGQSRSSASPWRA